MSDRPQGDLESDREHFVLADSGRLEAMAEFAAGAGHEINNPLATIIGRAQLLLKDEQDPQRRQMLMSIGAQAYRIRDMIGDAMLFGRPPLPELHRIDLTQLINQTIDRLATDFSNDRCTTRLIGSDSAIVNGDGAQLSIVVSELLKNSRQALQPGGGEIELAISTTTDFAAFEITDHGKGFTEVERRHAFDPFYSGRQAGRGLGFGLSKCWRIVQQHQGQISIRSLPAGPTTVRVELSIA